MKKILGSMLVFSFLLLFTACGKKVTTEDLKASDWLVESPKASEPNMILSFSDHVVSFNVDTSSMKSTSSNEWEEMGEEFAKSLVDKMSFKFEYTLEGDVMTLKNDENKNGDAKYTVSKEDKNIILTPEKSNKSDDTVKLVLEPYKKKKSNESSTSTSSTNNKTQFSSTVDSVSESDTSEKIETTIGKRSNPISLGTTATFDTQYYTEDGKSIEANMSMTVSNVLRGQEAMNYLTSANQFNEAAPAGKEWVIFDVVMKMNKGSHDDPYYVMPSFTPVSSNGEEVAQEDYGTLNDGEEFGSKDLYEGGTQTGKVALLVPVGDDTLIEFDDFNSKIFFKLQ